MEKESNMFRSRSTSLASRKLSKKEESEEQWDYVSFKKVSNSVNPEYQETIQFTFDENNMPLKSENHRNGSHHNINYEVAQKQELGVIYECVEPQNNKNRTMCIILTVIIVILCLGGGVGVALWQAGLFSSDVVSEQNIVNISDTQRKVIKEILTNFHPTLKPSDTTLLQKVDQLVTENDSQNILNVISVNTTQSSLEHFSTVRTTTSPATTIAQENSLNKEMSQSNTPFEQFATEATGFGGIILEEKRTKDDKMFLLLNGGINDMDNDQEIGEIIGHRRKGNDKGCQTLESRSPYFTKLIGTVFLPAIDAIVSCGYTGLLKSSDDHYDDPMTSCFIYNKLLSEWQHVNLIQRMGFYEGAFFSWHNRLVLFGGNSISRTNNDDIKRSITRSITIFEFSAVKDLYGYHTDSEEMYGSGDSYNYDDSDDSYEGSADGEEDTEVKIMMVENADHLIEEYGPGAIEGCAVSLKEKADSVSFIVTGGKNEGPNGMDGTTLRKTMKAYLKLDQYGSPSLGREHEFLPLMNYARKQHGCAKMFINGQETLIVAGGSNHQDNPISEVEFLGLKEITNWKIFGTLTFPRFGFPTIGKISGVITVVGGRRFDSSQSDKLDIDLTNENVVETIEVYDEKIHNFRSAIISDNLGKTSIAITRYDYYGVFFPKSWCHL